jgi:hypothetical protein
MFYISAGFKRITSWISKLYVRGSHVNPLCFGQSNDRNVSKKHLTINHFAHNKATVQWSHCTVSYIQSAVIKPTLIQSIQKEWLRMTAAHCESEILSFSLDQCCLLDPAPILSALKEKMSKTTAQWTTDISHLMSLCCLGLYWFTEFMDRLRKNTARWIQCSFQFHQIIPGGAYLACSHRRPEEKDGSKGNRGS